jgi:hypothetical protein
MKYDRKNRRIELKKTLNVLDKFTLGFVGILEEYMEYVLVSGYVSIVLGRSRASEDIDLLVKVNDKQKFLELFEKLIDEGYECANTMKVDEAYEMLNDHAIRFFEKGKPLPNMEFKMVSNEIHKYALENRISLDLGNKTIFISPLELQIAYKLSLVAKGNFDEISSDKDFEDAKHIYELFKDDLDYEEFEGFIKQFNVMEMYEVLKE